MNLAGESPNYLIDIDTALDAFLHRWAALADDGASPFHAVPWLRSWYTALGMHDGSKPLFLGVRRADTGSDVMLLPLTNWQQYGLSIVGFADAGIVDYNAPLVAPDWAGLVDNTDAQAALVSAGHLWAAVRKALQGHDVLQIDKMLVTPLDENLQRFNPLELALRSRLKACEMFGNQFYVADDWDTWCRSLPKRVRKEFERSWRVFTRSTQARFERVTDPLAALQLFEELERQQTRRMDQLDFQYVLDQPVFRTFHRLALAGGLADGSVVLTALRDGNEVVAAQFGVANRHRYIALRLSNGGEAEAR